MGGTIHSSEYRQLLELLRAARTKAGLSQVELATRLGRPQSYVSKVEVGERRLDIEELRMICQILGIDMVAFIRTWLRRL